jgi:hypothetical protein
MMPERTNSSPDSSGNRTVLLKKKRLQRIAGGFVLRNRNRSVLNTKTELPIGFVHFRASVPSEFITIFSINALSDSLFITLESCARSVFYPRAKPQ